MTESPPLGRATVLRRTYALSYPLLLVNMIGFLREVDAPTVGTAVYVAAVYLTYGLIYLLPPLLLSLAVNAAVSWKRAGGSPADDRSWRSVLVHAVAVVGFALVQIVIFADVRVHAMYGFHINGFVLNLVSTPGGIASMDLGAGTETTLALIAVGAVVAQALVLLAARSRRWPAIAFPPRRTVVIAVVAAVAMTIGERLAYAVCLESDFSPVLVASEKFPAHKGLKLHGLARWMGVTKPAADGVRMHEATGALRYPLAPIRQQPRDRPNIVWLACESLRADALNPEVMPATWEFAKDSTRFAAHCSAGNGTRMGMFGMFYGLYGPYWFPILAERRGPVLLDVIRRDGYQMSAFTSAAFTYPEFDRTIFAQFPPDELHAYETGIGWKSDRKNVGDLLDGIDRRDPARPFFTFMFFESPHASYRFPPESVIRTPYLDEMNYATMDAARDVELIRNRYLNACHHLDSQLARVFDHLRESGLLDHTIVIVTGDHGEEFMEKGRLGHNSAYSEEQTRTPLVIRAPGKSPGVVTDRTSHCDIPATVMALLGVENPPDDYSLGHDLFARTDRDYVVVSEWNDFAYFGPDAKVVFPTRAYGYVNQVVTTKDDAPIADKTNVLRAHVSDFAEIMRGLSRFRR
ncbi:MAG: sulfatase-like hydrolase/transferase [Planctomycetes bacterium]|nr:sulfatase-like hydrolase/transferase [Planctomycetota bacterium]